MRAPLRGARRGGGLEEGFHSHAPREGTWEQRRELARSHTLPLPLFLKPSNPPTHPQTHLRSLTHPLTHPLTHSLSHSRPFPPAAPSVMPLSTHPEAAAPEAPTAANRETQLLQFKQWEQQQHLLFDPLQEVMAANGGSNGAREGRDRRGEGQGGGRSRRGEAGKGGGGRGGEGRGEGRGGEGRGGEGRGGEGRGGEGRGVATSRPLTSIPSALLSAGVCMYVCEGKKAREKSGLEACSPSSFLLTGSLLALPVHVQAQPPCSSCGTQQQQQQRQQPSVLSPPAISMLSLQQGVCPRPSMQQQQQRQKQQQPARSPLRGRAHRPPCSPASPHWLAGPSCWVRASSHQPPAQGTPKPPPGRTNPPPGRPKPPPGRPKPPSGRPKPSPGRGLGSRWHPPWEVLPGSSFWTPNPATAINTSAPSNATSTSPRQRRRRRRRQQVRDRGDEGGLEERGWTSTKRSTARGEGRHAQSSSVGRGSGSHSTLAPPSQAPPRSSAALSVTPCLPMRARPATRSFLPLRLPWTLSASPGRFQGYLHSPSRPLPQGAAGSEQGSGCGRSGGGAAAAGGGGGGGAAAAGGGGGGGAAAAGGGAGAGERAGELTQPYHTHLSYLPPSAPTLTPSHSRITHLSLPLPSLYTPFILSLPPPFILLTCHARQAATPPLTTNTKAPPPPPSTAAPPPPALSAAAVVCGSARGEDPHHLPLCPPHHLPLCPPHHLPLTDKE